MVVTTDMMKRKKPVEFVIIDVEVVQQNALRAGGQHKRKHTAFQLTSLTHNAQIHLIPYRHLATQPPHRST